VSRRGVLLDRDGTIIADSGYVGAVNDVVFLDGAIQAIARLNAAGVPVAVVTNQAGVARGYFELDDVELVHKHMAAEMARHGAHVDAWFFCPYHPEGRVRSFARVSADRKPGPGLALAAATSLGLDLATSWVVGDSECDVGMAEAVGAHAFLISADQNVQRDHVTVVPDLATAVDLIIREGAAPPLTPPATTPSTFPSRRYGDTSTFASEYSHGLARALASVDHSRFAQAALLLNEAYDRSATVYTCGNGGSASIANHFQCDHVKGVRGGTGLLTRVHSLSTNVEILSAVANDIGYEHVFSFQLQSQARPGDVLVAVSSSGRSPNIVRALEWCADNGIETIAMTGFNGGPARDLATVAIHVEAENYGIVEDAHQACMHLLAQFVRQARMSTYDVAASVF
jgi:D-sedoheptulose 7-phosphate isomerase/D-glycero-D-manno-heptose 1,7-bisphosphate phosphatase